MTSPPVASLSSFGDEAKTVLIAAAVWGGAVIGLRAAEGDAAPFALLFAWGAAVFLGGFLVRRRIKRLPDRSGADEDRGVGWLFVALGCLGLAACFAFRAQRLYQPMAPGMLQAVAVVRGDPEPIGAGWRLEIQLSTGERLEATAFGSASFVARQLNVGESVMVLGTNRDIGDRQWLVRRHLVGRLAVQEIELLAEADWFNRIVNRVRQVIDDGTVGFSSRDQALYLGLVIGDDRFQHESQKAQFRAAGLTHLLAVSGQNVAFVLLVVRPLLLLFGLRTRMVIVVAVLVLFVAVTRAEPSVLRAVAVAVVGIWATTTGRSRVGLQALAAGTSVMILIDPFLVAVVGFQLSVAASAGIIVLGPALTERLPVPRLLAEPLAVTVAAQLAVAPLLIGYFGPLPLAALPANVLAGWAAGAVMTAGLTAGPIAGMLDWARFSTAASILQWPTRQLVAWIDFAASSSAAVPLPRLDGRSLVVMALVAVALAARPRSGPFAAATAIASTVILTATLAGAMPQRPESPVEFESGAVFFPAVNNHPSVLLVESATRLSVVDELLSHNISSLDFVAFARGDRSTGHLATAVSEVADVGLVLAPAMHRIRGATRTTEVQHIETGWGLLILTPDHDGNSLDMEVRARR